MSYLAVDLGMGAEISSLVVLQERRWHYAGGRKIRRAGRPDVIEHRYRDPTTGQEAADCPPTEYHLRHIERMPGGTSYGEVVTRVKALHETLNDPTIVLDATGVGNAAIELFHRSMLYPYTVTLTAGDKVEEDAPRFRVPKRDVITAAQVALQEQRVRIARGLRYGELLLRELQSFRMTTDLRKTNETLAWREGTNDDLVLALSIGLWIAERNVGAAWDALIEDDEAFRREHPFYSPQDFTGIFSRGPGEPFDPDEL